MMTLSDLDPFFLLSEPRPNRCVADLAPDGNFQTEKILCQVFPGHQRSRRLSAYDVIVPCDPPPDVIFTWMSACLIQEKVKQILLNEHLTGFCTRPAQAKIKATSDQISVSELIVTGWAGVAPASSGIREIERCKGCGYLRYSPIEEPKELIDAKSWDGSDFFMIWPLPRYIFVTERVVEIFKRYALSGVVFEQYFPFSPGRSHGYSPGRLSYYMPSDRAHAIGDEADIY